MDQCIQAILRLIDPVQGPELDLRQALDNLQSECFSAANPAGGNIPAEVLDELDR